MNNKSTSNIDTLERVSKINGKYYTMNAININGEREKETDLPQDASNSVSGLLSKLRSKNRMLSTDNFFLVDVLTEDEVEGTIGKYSIYCDKFQFQLFKLESDKYKIGFQDISYIKGVNITDTFVISMKENPDYTISQLFYNHLFDLIKSNKSRILNENNSIFKEVYVYYFLDPIKKHRGNHYVYKFSDVKLYDLDLNDANLDFNGANLVDKEITLKFNTVDVNYYDTKNLTVQTFSIDLIRDKFEKSKPLKYQSQSEFLTKQQDNSIETSLSNTIRKRDESINTNVDNINIVEQNLNNLNKQIENIQNNSIETESDVILASNLENIKGLADLEKRKLELINEQRNKDTKVEERIKELQKEIENI